MGKGERETHTHTDRQGRKKQPVERSHAYAKIFLGIGELFYEIRVRKLGKEGYGR